MKSGNFLLDSVPKIIIETVGAKILSKRVSNCWQEKRESETEKEQLVELVSNVRPHNAQLPR